ncbi:hypothetical protein OCU04_001820 [Sclerotinia nivalis]|uniref:Uncharacterized protein n=1 Tax=Sclerotinia nivalis TaxID=352851 RepID=A0A9X0AZC3_9HELO|nr:hypothetical protein OCU04_001820 [Sclerotinia nivalis]
MSQQIFDPYSLRVHHARIAMEAFYAPTNNINRQSLRKKLLKTLKSLLADLKLGHADVSMQIPRLEKKLVEFSLGAARFKGRRRVRSDNFLTEYQEKINRCTSKFKRLAEDARSVRG